MTSYKDIFQAFLSKITADDWSNGQPFEVIFADWVSLLESAIPYFKFPRVSLKRVYNYEEDPENGYFVETLGNQEIQILATLMKQQWLERTINSWENVRVMYDERDFSQANLLDKFIKLLEQTEKQSFKLQKLYARSIENEDGYKQPYKFSNLAGDNNG